LLERGTLELAGAQAERAGDEEQHHHHVRRRP
jgi:hypothetical protein